LNVVIDYQPGWTLVAAGIKTLDSLKRPEDGLIPNGVDWIKTKVASFDPEKNSVTLANDKKIKYDYLVMATGIFIDFDGVKFLILF
jgi:sulfide:quinone oxidoreductase